MDRLAELKRTEPANGDIEMGQVDGAQPPADVDGPMREFYQEVDFLKEKMKRVESNIKAIDEAYTQELTTISADKAEQLTKQLESLIAETNKESQVISARLKQMAAANKSGKGSNAELRMRASLHGALAKKFYELMAAYQGLKSVNAARYRERVRRQVEIASGEPPTAEQLDELLAGGDANRLFANKLLADRRNADAAHALEFLRERHSDIVRLEAQMNELYQIFVDMATLVDAQGELLDQIEHNVGQSQAYTAEAVVELKKANKWAIRARKKKCIIVCLVIVCLIIIAVAIAVPVALALK